MTEESFRPCQRQPLHAGTTESWETNLPHQQAIEQVLGEITELARASLLAGASALNVVEAAVIALEDCPRVQGPPSTKMVFMRFDSEHFCRISANDCLARSSHRRQYLWSVYCRLLCDLCHSDMVCFICRHLMQRVITINLI
jgi:Asparaginase